VLLPQPGVDGLQGGHQAHGQHQQVEGQDGGLGQPQEQILAGRPEAILAQQEVGHKVPVGVRMATAKQTVNKCK